MKVLLVQFDGKFPNLALMRIASHHKDRGDEVTLRHIGNLAAVDALALEEFDKAYGSLIFEWNRPVASRLLQRRPDAILGGSGWDEVPNDGTLVAITARKEAAVVSRVEDHGIATKVKDYSPDEAVASIWRGEPFPKQLILWDNDTFGTLGWRETFRAIRDGGYRVSFNQGVNARLMNEENAEALANTPCYADDFKTRRWYTAWDNRNDEEVLFRGLRNLVKYGVRPDQIMVYIADSALETPAWCDSEIRQQRRTSPIKPITPVCQKQATTWNREPSEQIPLGQVHRPASLVSLIFVFFSPPSCFLHRGGVS